MAEEEERPRARRFAKVRPTECLDDTNMDKTNTIPGLRLMPSEESQMRQVEAVLHTMHKEQSRMHLHHCST